MKKQFSHVKIDADNHTIARFWLILLIILAGLGFVYWARSALILLGLAAFLAIALNPIINSLTRKIGRRSLAAAIVYFAALLLIMLSAWFVLPSLVKEISNIVQSIPDVVNSAFDHIANMKLFSGWNVDEVRNEILGIFNSNKQGWFASIGSSLVSGIGLITSSLVSGLVLIVLSLMLSMDLPKIKQYVFSLYRNQKTKQHHQKLAQRMYSIVVGFVGGQMVVALINAVMASLVILILSLFFPIPRNLISVFSLILFLFSTIPMFGTTIGLLITSIMMLFYSWQAVLIFVIYYVIYQQVEGNVISPLIQSKRVDLSPLLVLISITVGIYMFGLLGGVIAIPIVGCLKVILEDYIANRRH